MGYHVVFENSIGGELDGRFAQTEEEIRSAVIELARAVEFRAGDVIRIIEVEK